MSRCRFYIFYIFKGTQDFSLIIIIQCHFYITSSRLPKIHSLSIKRLICISPRGALSLQQQSGTLPGWDICTVASLKEAQGVLATQLYLVGLLLNLSDIGTVADVDVFLQQHSHVRWISVIDRGLVEESKWADLLHDHCSDFHTYPIDHAHLCYALGHAHGWANLRTLRTKGKDLSIPTIDGWAPLTVALRAKIGKFALVNAPVLIQGESGSGKELVAHAIHAHSRRAGGPFVPVNCGALQPSLIQSELFGHERGAFTGATGGKIGLIESANGGTIFLDEIGDLPGECQVTLLRFLQEGMIMRIGSTREIRVDVRVVVASHVDLMAAAAINNFREDLFYRLNVLPVHVPPLRERRADLPELVKVLFERHANEKAPQVKGLSSQAIRAIQNYDWPGNVRELSNCLRRAMVLAEGRLIQASDLNLPASLPQLVGASLAEIRTSAERAAICESLGGTGNNMTASARNLKVSRMTLYRLMTKHNITE